jgi:hypothetical protein
MVEGGPIGEACQGVVRELLFDFLMGMVEGRDVQNDEIDRRMGLPRRGADRSGGGDEEAFSVFFS